MAYIEIDTPSGVLGYDVKNNIASLSACRGRDVRIEIPAAIEFGDIKVPVQRISKKAFLSHKYLHEVVVPDSVTSIGDWGFARCSSLERIYLHRGIALENGVFKDCNNLTQVFIDDDESERARDVSYMLAAVIQLLDDKYLFDLNNAGTDEWIANWDNRMDVILGTPDDEGFIALLACGEEDYEGRDNTLDGFLSNSRKRKVHICMTRLMHSYGLNSERSERLKRYLYMHRAGSVYSLSAYDKENDFSDGYLGRICVSNSYDEEFGINTSLDKDDLVSCDEAWKVVLEEHGDEEEYYQLLMDCDCIDSNNLNIMLDEMGEKHARMKAFLLREKSTKKASDFFDSLDL